MRPITAQVRRSSTATDISTLFYAVADGAVKEPPCGGLLRGMHA